MAYNTHGEDLGDFLDREVYPALYDRLDAAFPEFGFRRKGSAWIATNAGGSRSLPGSPRPDRVYCYRNTPFLLVVQGGERMPLLHYAAGGRPPRGVDFVEAVRKLAGLAGVRVPEREYTPEERQRTERRERQRDIRDVFLAKAHELLLTDWGVMARAYLEKRGFPADRWEEFGFGFCPSGIEIKNYLLEKGFTAEEIGAAWREVKEQGAPVGSGLLYDGRWEGRLVGPWRDRAGRVVNVWARDLTGTAEASAKYLFAKTENPDEKPKASPFGLDTAHGREVVLVEGLLDVLAARVHGLADVVGLGGAALGEEQITALRGAGIRTVTLNLDHDPQSGAGLAGTLKAIDSLAGSSLRVYVVDPAAMANPADPSEKVDPDLYVRRHGAEAYRELLQQARRGTLFRAEALLREHDLTTDKGKDAAVSALLAYDERLHDGRDTEDLWRLTAERTGYSYETLSQLALSHTERRERERLNKDLTALLEDSSRNLVEQETTPEALVQTLAGKLERLKVRAHVDEPPAFSVESLVDRVKNQPDGKRTGWGVVDALGIRFHPGELAVMGARTGHGKTTVLLGLMLNWLTVYPEESFLFFSYELPPEAVFLKLASTLTRKLGGEGWSYYEIKDFLQNRDPERQYTAHPDEIKAAFARLKEWEERLTVVYRPAWTVEAVTAYARKVHERSGNLGAVLADYLQIIPPPEGDFDRRDMEVSSVARKLKGLSVDLGCPIVTAAQINREAAREGTIPAGKPFEDPSVLAAIKKRRPQLHQLREGGSEQEADLVLGLLNYRADYVEAQENGSAGGDRGKPGPFDVSALKNRFGEIGTAALMLEGRTGYIRDREDGEGA